MDCKIKDFYILTINNVTYLNQEIYSNKTVEYKNTLYWDELILFKDCYATVYFDDKVHNIEPNDILFLPSGKHTQYAQPCKMYVDTVGYNIQNSEQPKISKGAFHSYRACD